MVLEYSPGCNFFGIAGHHLIMDNDLGRLVDGREARRPHSALPSGTRLCYPFAAGGSKENDDDFVDDQEEEAPSAGPHVASSAQSQTHVSSFFKPAPATAADVARQLFLLTDKNILDFTSSRNTLHYQPIIAKLLCMQTSLAARFETIRTDVAAAAASPRGPSQMLLSPLPSPQQMPAPTEGMQSEDSLPAEPVPAVQIATPVQVEEEGAPARVAKPSGGQIGPRKMYEAATRKSTRTGTAAAEPNAAA